MENTFQQRKEKKRIPRIFDIYIYIDTQTKFYIMKLAFQSLPTFIYFATSSLFKAPKETSLIKISELSANVYQFQRHVNFQRVCLRILIFHVSWIYKCFKMVNLPENNIYEQLIWHSTNIPFSAIYHLFALFQLRVSYL